MLKKNTLYIVHLEMIDDDIHTVVSRCFFAKRVRVNMKQQNQLRVGVAQ